MAFLGLWRFGYPRTTELARAGDVDGLVQRLGEVRDAEDETTFCERAVIATALGQLRSEAAVSVLASLVEPSTRVDLRVCAADALRRIGGPEAAWALRPALDDERYAVKRAAIEVERRPDAQIWPKLKELAKSDPERLIRGAAVEALGRTQDDSMVPFLLSVAEQEDWLVAASAVDALAIIGSPVSYEALRKLRSQSVGIVIRLLLPLKMRHARLNLAQRSMQ